MSFPIGVDVGGTFTDVAILYEGEIVRGKSDTTHYDLKVGFMNAVAAAVKKIDLEVTEALRRADIIVYSTTVGTNALIERRGTKLGLITTCGFEDTMMVGRSRNWADGLPPEMKYDRGRAMRPEQLIAKERIVGVRERTDNLGNVVMPLQEDDVLEQVQKLVDQGVRGFVVVLLHSYANPVHEQRIRELIREQYPEPYLGHMPVFLSSEISPQIGEYRRTMTLVLDAFLRVETEQHLLRLTEDLREAGYRKPFFVAKNTGGISSLSRTQPLHLYGSSPAASVLGGDYIGQQIGRANVLITDMGGTSFDVGLVVQGRERIYELDPIIDRWRVQIPYIAHWSIGAGGGSIATVNQRTLHVGPQSAGSNPGPVCYLRGGEEPTVTDADVLLGYIDPEYFLGGRIRLDAARAERAIREKIADPLGLHVEEAAWNIKRLVDGHMGQEMYRITALNSGQDPQDFTLFALGGAGPVHCTGFADYADVRSIATFPYGSVFGAFGTLALDILQSYEKSVRFVVYSSDQERYCMEVVDLFNREVDALVGLAKRDMEEEGFDLSTVRLQLEAHMAYGQQRHHMIVDVSGLHLRTEVDLKELCDRFNRVYGEAFGKGAIFPEAGMEVIRLRLNAIGPRSKFQVRPVNKTTLAPVPREKKRRAYWGPEVGFVSTPVYQRDLVVAGTILHGPALVESEDTVAAVPPAWKFRMDEFQIGWIEKFSK